MELGFLAESNVKYDQKRFQRENSLAKLQWALIIVVLQ